MEPLTSATTPSLSSQLPGVELKDIHLPAQISDVPTAIGWWLLASLCITIVILSIIKFRAYRELRKGKRQALKQLKTEYDPTQIITTLKWVVMQYFPRHEVASLYGVSFQTFLISKLPIKHQEQFNQLTSSGFTSLYKEQQSQNTDTHFNQAALLWLTHALPPKKNNKRGNPS